ncbi:MAG: hypothetical protein ABWW70_00455 [Thermoproteota archaeon]
MLVLAVLAAAALLAESFSESFSLVAMILGGVGGIWSILPAGFDKKAVQTFIEALDSLGALSAWSCYSSRFPAVARLETGDHIVVYAASSSIALVAAVPPTAIASAPLTAKPSLKIQQEKCKLDRAIPQEGSRKRNGHTYKVAASLARLSGAVPEVSTRYAILGVSGEALIYKVTAPVLREAGRELAVQMLMDLRNLQRLCVEESEKAD